MVRAVALLSAVALLLGSLKRQVATVTLAGSFAILGGMAPVAAETCTQCCLCEDDLTECRVSCCPSQPRCRDVCAARLRACKRAFVRPDPCRDLPAVDRRVCRRALRDDLRTRCTRVAREACRGYDPSRRATAAVRYGALAARVKISRSGTWCARGTVAGQRAASGPCDPAPAIRRRVFPGGSNAVHPGRSRW